MVGVFVCGVGGCGAFPRNLRRTFSEPSPGAELPPCWQVWHDQKLSYVGAHWHRGFSSPLLLHVARALQRSLPFVAPHDNLPRTTPVQYQNNALAQYNCP